MAITYRIGHDGRLSVQEMDGNFQYIEDELGTLSSTIQSLDLAGLTASVLALEGDVAGLTSDVASATASIATLNTNVASATASIATLNTNVASATASIATLNTNVAGLTASVIDLQNAFSSITGDFNLVLLIGATLSTGTFSFTNGILATYSNFTTLVS